MNIEKILSKSVSKFKETITSISPIIILYTILSYIFTPNNLRNFQLDQNFETITSNIPDMYFFSDGVNGYSIIDGGNDMYDGGNQLSTPSGVILYYSDGLVVSNDNLGQGGSYFTRKYNGLFLFVADINNIPFFEITGNNGADNGGTVNGSVLETTINGKTFYGFVKRVFNAGDPSINHLFIVEANEGLSHEFATNTDNDYHRVFGLENSDRLYYLLYSRIYLSNDLGMFWEK